MVNSLLLHRLSITLSTAITTVTHLLLDDMDVEKPRRKRGRPRRKRNPPKPPGSPTSILAAPVKFRSQHPVPRSLPRPSPLNVRRTRSEQSTQPPLNTLRRRRNSSWPPPYLPDNAASLPQGTLRCRLRRSNSPGNGFLTIELPQLPPVPQNTPSPEPAPTPPPPASVRRQQSPLADIQLPQQTMEYQSLPEPPSQMKPIIPRSKSYRSALRSIIRDVPEPSENTPTALTPAVRSSRRVRFSHTVQLVY